MTVPLSRMDWGNDPDLCPGRPGEAASAASRRCSERLMQRRFGVISEPRSTLFMSRRSKRTILRRPSPLLNAALPTRVDLKDAIFTFTPIWPRGSAGRVRVRPGRDTRASPVQGWHPHDLKLGAPSGRRSVSSSAGEAAIMGDGRHFSQVELLSVRAWRTKGKLLRGRDRGRNHGRERLLGALSERRLL